MLKSCLILISFYIFFVFSNTSNDYGSFLLVVHKFELCKGPKRKDCSESTVKINNDSTLNYKFYVKENTTPTKGKIAAITNGKEFLRFQMKRPCDHLFLRPLFQSLMNVTKNCVILKGHYHFKIDIQDIAQKYYAGTFLFGNWTFKSFFYNDECNFVCTQVEVEMLPKNSSRTTIQQNLNTTFK